MTEYSKQSKAPAPKMEIGVVSNLDDWMKVAAVRSLVYISEQLCPYDEEFDGNDFTATNFLASVDGEPAATVRLRYFADFAKIERLAVRRQFREAALGREIFQYVLDFCARKGYQKVVGQHQVRLKEFMSRCFGAEITGQPFHFSDHEYYPFAITLKRPNDHFTADSDLLVLARPEGKWDAPGVIEKSLVRPPTNPGVEVAQ